MSKLSITENKVLMAQAREALEGKWGLGIGTTVVFMLVMTAINIIPVAGWLIGILISGSMSIGLASFALSLSRKHDAALTQIFSGFEKFGVGLGAHLLTTIFVVLWTLLLIIPGIIAALSYSMTYYIIAESDSIGPLEAITKSKEMMRGNKWKFFRLGLRFLGWGLLCILTLGIGFLWLFPYMIVSYTQFYDDIREDQAGSDRKGPSSDILFCPNCGEKWRTDEHRTDTDVWRCSSCKKPLPKKLIEQQDRSGGTSV
jgi:uncharacterized membrane protein